MGKIDLDETDLIILKLLFIYVKVPYFFNFLAFSLVFVPYLQQIHLIP
ncbi:hypothetical protein LCGC14_1597120 [marine sediment metagenome]|uniref:Uncharacterized protein n=1 Tax=marine sediment metagenome TaxID=412755 RepID=A0A0F9IYM9_9ZZZZ